EGQAPPAEPVEEAPAEGWTPPVPVPVERPPIVIIIPGLTPPPAPQPVPAELPGNETDEADDEGEEEPVEAAPPNATEPAPQAPAPQPSDAWPRAGSHVRYQVQTGDSAPGTYTSTTWANATWTYDGKDWSGSCTGTKRTAWEDGNVTVEPIAATYSASSPPHWPPFNPTQPPRLGDDVTVWLLWACDIRSETMEYDGRRDGGRTYAAEEPLDASPYSDFSTRWDAGTGLVLEWDWARRMSGVEGRLVATDAPVRLP
ncbi:MAG TPA: hypothetical protein VFH47_05885, partial [Candidatus Thermoplasmatota archaeon]|nr:hypothetical protein [Candidatus Thermoplasmatota archaeon]